VAISAGVGLLWVVLLGAAYRRHSVRPAPTRRLALVAAITVTAATAFAWGTALPTALRLYHRARPTFRLTARTWLNGGYARLPAYQIDLQGRGRYPLNVQWLGNLHTIEQRLTAHGWRYPKPFTPANALLWLSGNTAIGILPVLPQLHDGHSQALVMTYAIDADHQWVLRLWPTEWHRGSDHEPLWVGSANLQQLRNWLFILHIPTATLDFESPLPELSRQLSATDRLVTHPRAHPIPPRLAWKGDVLLVGDHALRLTGTARRVQAAK
jgi:undecaprenyl-diphosphatase